MKVVFLVLGLTLLSIGCKKKVIDYSTTSKETSKISTSNTVSPITVNQVTFIPQTSFSLIIQNTNNIAKSGYWILMFKSEPIEGQPLPLIEL